MEGPTPSHLYERVVSWAEVLQADGACGPFKCRKEATGRIFSSGGRRLFRGARTPCAMAQAVMRVAVD